MSCKINFQKQKKQTAHKHGVESQNIQQVSLDEIKSDLRDTHPGKFLFTIQETAGILNVSYDFVRKAIKKNLIPATVFGDRKLIYLNHLAHVIKHGVN
jgi:excisionase family DNA binding protein